MRASEGTDKKFPHLPTDAGAPLHPARAPKPKPKPSHHRRDLPFVRIGLFVANILGGTSPQRGP